MQPIKKQASMDWRLSRRNAEPNYKIIIDKEAVKTGGNSIPPLPTQAGLGHQQPPKFLKRKRACCMHDLLAHGCGLGRSSDQD
jgi:hypothetical protein